MTPEFELQVTGAADPDRLDDVTRQLLAEVRQLDVDFVRLKSESGSPIGAKSGDAVTIGAIVLAVSPVVLPQLISFLKEWCLRRRDHPIKITRRSGKEQIEVEYDVGSMSKQEVEQLLESVKHEV